MSQRKTSWTIKHIDLETGATRVLHRDKAAQARKVYAAVNDPKVLLFNDQNLDAAQPIVLKDWTPNAGIVYPTGEIRGVVLHAEGRNIWKAFGAVLLVISLFGCRSDSTERRQREIRNCNCPGETHPCK